MVSWVHVLVPESGGVAREQNVLQLKVDGPCLCGCIAQGQP